MYATVLVRIADPMAAYSSEDGGANAQGQRLARNRVGFTPDALGLRVGIELSLHSRRSSR
jgi:hypothetical protein